MQDRGEPRTVSAASTASTEQKELVARILASDLFSKSHRLSAFLAFIFDQYSRGHAAGINEQRIGTEVFGRPQGYHVGEDSIVRSQARFLRQRLDEYFAGEGKSEPLVLLIPKGSYVPAFERRETPAPISTAKTVLSPATAPALAGVPGHTLPGSLWMYRLWLSIACCAVVLLCGLLYMVQSRERSGARHESSAGSRAVQAFWASLFNPDRTVLIVPADSTLVLMEELSGKPVRLLSYINKEYLNEKPPGGVALWNMLLGSQYTNIADLNLVAQLQRVPEAARARPQIRYARDLNLKELKDSNAILIGGMRANPWVELFSSAVSFDVDYDPTTRHNIVRNRAPGPKEKALYMEESLGPDGESHAYGVVAYLPSLDNQGHTLLVEGTSKAGTEAAAEFLTGPALGRFLAQIGVTGVDVPAFEVLLYTGNMDGASYHPIVVCRHLLHTNASG